ncbi:hypothetical protein Bbelb_275850 [Branchiostoma belcheri]|nr:hypothetical protein Bbelb_275850 [Branchiostoma belcheri]
MPKHVYDGERCIQPYAVSYCEEHDVHVVESGGAAAKSMIAPDGEDIQPYAIAYMVQGEVVCRTTSGDTLLTSNSINDVATNPSGNDDPNVPNQTNVPNAQQPAARGCMRHPWACLAVMTAAVLGLCIVSGISLWLYFSTSPPQWLPLILQRNFRF